MLTEIPVIQGILPLTENLQEAVLLKDLPAPVRHARMCPEAQDQDLPVRLDPFRQAVPRRGPQEVPAQRLQGLLEELKDNIKNPYYEKKYTFGNVIPVEFNLYRSIT